MEWIWKNTTQEKKFVSLSFYAKVQKVRGQLAFLYGPNCFLERPVWFPKELCLIEGLWHRFEVYSRDGNYYLHAISASASRSFLLKYFKDSLL